MPELAEPDAYATDPLWYKDAIIYQCHVKAFFDHDGDGIGDFRGLTEKLDYIQALGVNAIWLLPFYPSPMRDDGYDISDYRNVHPAYGTRRDVRRFISAAHRRGLRVIVELIINHTSDQHPWFQAARRAPKGSRKRDFYVWSDDDSRFSETRIIFTDSEASNWTWDPVAEQYYWHRFFAHQPDLNHNNPQVVKAVIRVMRFWLDLGVDGLRLDAIPYLCVRDGTSNENLPETHAVIKQMRAVVDAHYKNRMFLAEANQWPEDVRDYFGASDECHVCYHFPLMPRMYMALAQEDRHPIVEILEQTPAIPADCQWALFLRNHDELTLEMVSDRERDYMYQTYAADPRMRVNVGIRRRLAPLLGNDPAKIRLMVSLLLSMPGAPILYYGDELGMGDNIYLGDRNAVRTPMQWTPDRNAGFSRADPEQLYLPPVMDAVYGYQAVNVEAQSRSAASLLNWMRRIIAVRKAHRVFGRGGIEFLHPGNRKVVAYVRETTAIDPIPAGAEAKPEVVLCVANLGRGAQPVELDLARFRGRVPIELLGRTPFPPIGELPYLLTLAGYGFYWFLLSDEAEAPSWHDERSPRLATLVLPEGWQSLFPERAQRPEPARRARQLLDARILPDYLAPRFRRSGDGIALSAARLNAITPWRDWLLTLIDLELANGQRARMLLPLWLLWQSAETALESAPPAVTTLARARRHAVPGLLCDALADVRFVQALIALIGAGEALAMGEGSLVGAPSAAYARLTDAGAGELVQIPRPDQGASVALGERLFLTLQPVSQAQGAPEEGAGEEGVGMNGLAIRRYLSDVAGFANTPVLAGALEYRHQGRPQGAVAVLEEYVDNQGNLRDFTLELLARLGDAHGEDASAWQQDAAALSYAPLITALGQRLAELHEALAAADAEPALAPQPLSAAALAQQVAALSTEIEHTLAQLARLRVRLPAALQVSAEAVLAHRDALRRELGQAAEVSGDLLRIRVHGDLGLTRVLVAENDILFVDVGGDWRTATAPKRAQACPLTDVARLVYAFHEVADEALQARHMSQPNAEMGPPLVAALGDWRARTCERFLDAYRAALGPRARVANGADLAPAQAGALTRMWALYEAVTRLRVALATAEQATADSQPQWSEPIGPRLRVLLSLLQQARWW